MRSIQLPIALLALASLAYCQYFGDLTATPSAYQAFNVSLPGSPFLLNFADNDLTVRALALTIVTIAVR